MNELLINRSMLLAVGETPSLVVDLVVILAAAAIATLSLGRLRLATIPGYLITGMIIGPYLLGAVRNGDNIESISGLAVILLMFTIGLHLDLGGMRKGMVPILMVGAVSSLGCTVVGWPLLMIFGLPAPAALVVAIALAMSSTAVVLRVLQQRREMQRTTGRMCFGILLVQDLLVLVALAVLPPIAVWGGVELSGGAARVDAAAGDWPRSVRLLIAGGYALGGIAIMIVFGRYVLPRVLREAERVASDEVILVISAAVALGSAAFAGYLGFSPELGAFLAGFMLATTPFRYQISGQLAPLRDLFMAVFFTAVGLKVDPGVIVEHWWVILFGLTALLVVKAGLIGGVAWSFGAPGPVALVVGLSLAQAGEFTLVLLLTPEATALVPETVRAEVLAVVVLSLIVTPALCVAARREQGRLAKVPLAPWINRSVLQERGVGAAETEEAGEQPPAPTVRHVVVAGFGVVGRAITDRLTRSGIPVTTIELNPATVRTQRDLGRKIVYGDVTNMEVLDSAGVRDADAVILTIPDDDATLRACRMIRGMAPGAFIAARTTYLSKAMLASSFGADHVTVEEMATAAAMATEVLEKLAKRAEKREAAAGLTP